MDISVYEQLKNLKIDISGVQESSITAWNYKHLPDTAAFFNWFTKYLNESNILEPSENEEYNYLVEKGLILQDDEYDIAITEIEQTHPDILDLELNKSQIHIIEAEYQTLMEYERNLEKQIEANMEISKRIEKEIRSARNKTDVLSIKYDQTYETCLVEAKKVDCGFSDLRLKVYDCLECWNKDWSIFSSDNVKSIQKYKNGLANMTIFCNNFYLNSKAFELNQSCDSELETLEKRLYDAILYSYIAYVKEKQLESELAHYEDTKSLENALINTEDQWCAIQTESLELSRKINIDKSLELLSEVISKFVKNQIDKLNVIKSEKTVFAVRQKSEKLCEIDHTVTRILSCNDTHLNLYKIINTNIQAMDMFLRKELLFLVNADIRSCLNRTELMKEKIQRQNDDQQKSIENQNKLIRIIVDLISNEHIEEITSEIFKNVVKKFYGRISDYEKKLFFTDIEIYRNQVHILEKNNYFIKENLKSESNNEVVPCPVEFSLNFGKLKEITKEKDDIVKEMVQCRKSTDETLKRNKWLRIRRQLWMYFLVNPRKVIEYLKEITEENNKKIANQISDDNKIIQNAHMYLND